MARTFLSVKNKINRRAFKAISDEVPRLKREMQEEFREAIELAWDRSPTVSALKTNGPLVGDLGLENPAAKIDTIKGIFIRQGVKASKTRLLRRGKPELIGRIELPLNALLAAQAGYQIPLKSTSYQHKQGHRRSAFFATIERLSRPLDHGYGCSPFLSH